MKNGKYQKHRRAFMQNRAYFVIGLVLCMVIAAVVLICSVLPKKQAPAEPQTAQTVQEQPASEAAAPAVEEPAPEGTEYAFADGALQLYYDDAAVCVSKSGDLITFSEKKDGTARLDIQMLEGGMELLTQSELDRIAVGLLQAYYYQAPETEAVSVSGSEKTDTTYRCELSAPAYRDALAARASVRIFAVGDNVWCAILLCPEGADGAALQAALDSVSF